MKHHIIGEAVTASSAEFPRDSDRHRWFKLAPYGEKSAVMASGHQFTIPGPGIIKLPKVATSAHVNVEHDRKAPAGRFDMFKDLPTGLFGRVLAAATTTGSDALVNIDEGLRTGISVELETPVIRAGVLLAGDLSNAGLVVTPSFASATALASAADIGEVTSDLADLAAALQAVLGKLSASADAADTTDLEEEADLPDTTDLADSAQDAIKETLTPTPDENLTEEEKKNMTVTASSRVRAATTGPAAPVDHLRVLATAQATLSGIGSQSVKAAALDQITQGDVFDKVNAPHYAGELWKGRRYQGRYLDLLTEAPMVSQSVIGWRWVDGKTPQVARWSTPSSGNPATMNDIPTNEVKAEPVTHTGFRIAGGQAVDRIHQDLPSAEWWTSYNLESTDDYARKLDAEAIAHVTKSANLSPLELAKTTPTEKRILEAIGAAIEFSDPTFILLGWDVFMEMALGKKFDQSTAMASGGEATITLAAGHMSTSYLTIPVKAAPRSLTSQNGRVIVGSKYANELQSLPGGPIRVEAQNIGKGMIEHGVFGYHILRDIDKRGVIESTLATA